MVIGQLRAPRVFNEDPVPNLHWTFEDLALAKRLIAITDDVLINLRVFAEVGVRLHQLIHFSEVHLIEYAGIVLEKVVLFVHARSLPNREHVIRRFVKELEITSIIMWLVIPNSIDFRFARVFQEARINLFNLRWHAAKLRSFRQTG